jgi:hypothetical protein
MTTAEMLVVAVPSGTVTDGVARLRVLFVPRLQCDAPSTLADFGLEDWPNLLSRATFSAEIATDPAATRPLRVNAPAAHGDSAVWRGFFSPTMTVDPWQAQGYPTPHVDSTADKAARVTATYAESARAYVDPGTDAATVVRTHYAGWTDEDPPGPDSGLAPGDWQEPDFHRSVSMLREHSAVLVELGLVVELTIDADKLPNSPMGEAPLLVHILCTLGDGAPPIILTPVWTKFAFDGARFLPFAAPDSDIDRGMLDIGSAQMANAPGARVASKWLIATFDVDGAAGRLRDGAKSGGTSAELVEGVSLPVLHSVGPTLIRAGRAEHLERRAARGRVNIGGAAIDLRLSADDLILGYRVDIRPQSGSGWVPLCERTATYRIDGQPIGVAGAFDEGQIKANAAALGKNRVLQTNEVVARWSGWSLARPRPILDQNGPVPSAAAPVPLPFAFDWTFAATASLPSLRFGEAYRMRLRVADMAGGGLMAGEISANESASDPILYRRHEPIPPPEVAPPPDLVPPEPPMGTPPVNGFGVGGTLDCLVLRSDPGAGLDVAAFAAANPDYVHNDRRWLLPPSTSFTLAEQHGKLDGSDDATWRLAQRAMTAPQAATDGTYNWLPDPAALGIIAFVRPNPENNGSGATADAGWGAWPDITTKRLVLAPPITGKPLIEWSPDSTILTVRLPPAADIEIEMSCFPDARDLDQFEIKSWLAGAPDTTVAEGRHPMVTPPRVVRLVHPVRKPLAVPAGTFDVRRAQGQTAALLNPVTTNPKLGIHSASTGQLDIVASWSDMVDYPAYALDGLAPDAPLPAPAAKMDTLTPLRIDRDAAALPEFRHELGDTTHRTISYVATAISRFGDYFDDAPGEAFSQISSPIVTQIPGAAPPSPPVVLAAVPAYFWESVDPAAAGLPVGAIRRRRLGGRMRVDLARPWHKSGEGEQLAVILAVGGATPDEQASRIFRDPIWQTGLPTASLDASMFANPASAAAVTLLDGSQAIAMPFAASYDRDSGRWHADIEMPGAAAGSYSPFVRLKLARYQPNCLAGLEVSPTVTTDFLPLPLDRTLTIVPSGDGYDVTLEGVVPAGPHSNQLIVAVEEADQAVAGDLTDLAQGRGLWDRLPGVIATGLLNQALHLPLSAAGPDKSRRLIVREVEAIDQAFDHPVDDHFLSELHERTVFLDIIVI